jgi:enolase
MNSPHDIVRIDARQILDSRGRPTVEADVILANGTLGRACAPSGASTGRHEAHELRDCDPAQFGGLGVGKALRNISARISPALTGMNVQGQAEIDQRMREIDGTPNLSDLGANAVLAVSMAACRAAAAATAVPLHHYLNGLLDGRSMSMPMPMTNILSGGAHAGRGMDLQDFLVVPSGATTYGEALAIVNDIRAEAARQSTLRGLPILLADEGGLSPGLEDPRAALDLLLESIVAAGFVPGRDVGIALDIASTEFFVDEQYRLARQGRTLSGREMVDFIVELVADYPIVSIEDPLAEDDWHHWQIITRQLPHCQLLGDDLFATNAARIEHGAEQGVANAALIKLNQNGTVSGTLNAMQTAWDAGYATIVSARSGETDDSFIADLAVGSGAGQIKIGSTRSSERLSKYNQLLRIDEQDHLPFAGRAALANLPKQIQPIVAA